MNEIEELEEYIFNNDRLEFRVLAFPKNLPENIKVVDYTMELLKIFVPSNKTNGYITFKDDILNNDILTIQNNIVLKMIFNSALFNFQLRYLNNDKIIDFYDPNFRLHLLIVSHFNMDDVKKILSYALHTNRATTKNCEKILKFFEESIYYYEKV